MDVLDAADVERIEQYERHERNHAVFDISVWRAAETKAGGPVE